MPVVCVFLVRLGWGQVFAWLAAEGVGAMTVSHHISAALPHHTHMLALADDGSWTLTEIPVASSA